MDFEEWKKENSVILLFLQYFKLISFSSNRYGDNNNRKRTIRKSLLWEYYMIKIVSLDEM